MLDRAPQDLEKQLQWRDAAAPHRLTRPLVAFVSSRLGHHGELHRRVGQGLAQSMLRCRHRGGTALVADGSAIAPWALRAAELFDVPVVVLHCGDSSRPLGDLPPPVIAVARIAGPARPGKSPAMTRDHAVIEAADRVEAVFVRRGGRIERCLAERIARRGDASTRVAVVQLGRCAAASLIARGAVGCWVPAWLAPSASTGAAARAGNRGELPHRPIRTVDRWSERGTRWLVHCTRGCPGRWPGQSERQYLDSLLLGDASAADRGPLQTLRRIVRSRRLIASATATAQSDPVVCFSSVPLGELLARRHFRPHLQRWDYEPFGIGLRLDAAAERGIRPVLYGDRNDRRRIPEPERYRFQARGTTYDWTEEREWRARGDVDLTQFAVSDVQVFVPSAEMAAALQMVSPWPVTVAPLG